MVGFKGVLHRAWGNNSLRLETGTSRARREMHCLMRLFIWVAGGTKHRCASFLAPMINHSPMRCKTLILFLPHTVALEKIFAPVFAPCTQTTDAELLRLLAGMRRRFFLPAWSDEKAALIWQPESQSGLRYTHTFVRITERHTRNTWHFSMTFQPITKVNVLKGWTFFPFHSFREMKVK